MGIPDIESKVINSGLKFSIIGETAFPLGIIEKYYKTLGEMSGIAGINFTVNWLKQETTMLLRDAPNILETLGVEALLIDQVTTAGGTIADHLNLPFITVCNALLINRESGVPPFFTHWNYSKAWWARLRNQAGNFFINRITQSVRDLVKQLGLEAQLVISLGNPNSQESGSNFPGSPIVVAYAPHQQLIERASLVITHAGMNTTLGALSSGIPLVAIPITNEQPGIATRIVRTGAGEMIPVNKLSVKSLQKAVQAVLTENSYKQNAMRLQEAIKRAGGLHRAADIIEQAISTRQPVLSKLP